MGATFRPLAAWPYPPRRRLSGSRFGNTGRGKSSPREAALELLEEEIAAIKGSDVVIGLVVDERHIGFSGALKVNGWKALQHRGAEVSFAVPGGRRLVFYTDAFDDVVQNLRAIGLGLEALRAVERYGITSTSEQYAGFQMLEAGGDVERGRKLVAAAGGIGAALKRAHPDHGGTVDDFKAVQAFRASQGG